MKRAFQLGSISTGTLRPEDLLDTFYLKLVELGQTPTQADSGYIDGGESYADEELLDIYTDALQECCPPYVHFGTNEGDGADFGFCPDVDRLNADIADSEYRNGDDILLLEEMVLVTVNDHGNVTVMNMWTHEVYWECV